MSFRRLRRKIRCFFKYGPHRCPHIERHSRRRRAPKPPRGRHAVHP